MTGVVGYAPGAYDMFHIGHLNLLRRAREHCDYLIAGVLADAEMIRIKGHDPAIPAVERMEIVRSIRYVDEVVIDQGGPDKRVIWRQHRFDVIFKGSDWQDSAKGAELERLMAEVGARVHYLPYTETTSSTRLRQFLDRVTTGGSDR